LGDTLAEKMDTLHRFRCGAFSTNSKFIALW
jgi:hypothetical protein